MRLRPGRGTPNRSRGRRLALFFALGCGAFAVGAPIASAHSVSIAFNDCTSVTFAYHDFGQGNPYTAHETVSDNGKVVASKTFSFTPPLPQDTQTDTINLPGLKNGDSLVATTMYSGPYGSGTVTASHVVTGCPVTYTGDAYNLRASAKLLGNVTLSPLTINEVGPVSTMSAVSPSHTILSESFPPLGLNGAQLVSSITTGNNTSTANTSVNSLSVLGLPQGAPGITTSAVQSSSKTVCNASTNQTSSTGSTNIASLTIGNTVVVGPGGAVPSGPIPANTTIPLGPVGSVILNEQTPITGGLAVNAIHVKLLTDLGLGTVDVVIGHAESDVEGC